MEEDLLKIIEHFGVNNQQRKLQEEVFELNEAIINYENERPHCDDIADKDYIEMLKKTYCRRNCGYNGFIKTISTLL